MHPRSNRQSRTADMFSILAGSSAENGVLDAVESARRRRGRVAIDRGGNGTAADR